jgi:hypothetical protein
MQDSDPARGTYNPTKFGITAVRSSSMKHRYFVSLLAATVIALLVYATAAAGQSAQPVARRTPQLKVSSAAPSVPLQNPFSPNLTPPPHNADGHPDLSGEWNYRTSTPLERSRDHGTTLFLTPQEGTALGKRITESRNTDVPDVKPEDGLQRGMNNVWFEYGGSMLQYRTSLIVDPPDGRLPPMTPAGMEGTMRCSYCNGLNISSKKYATVETNTDSAKTRGVRERCLVVDQGPPIMVGAWHQHVRILQRKDYVVLETEMIHSPRTIWLDGRPHISSDVKQWRGDSIGHWEGDTLVVETTNFRPDSVWLTVLHPENFKLMERFTRIDGDTVLYEYTINDPETWTKPWTVQIPMAKFRGYMFEYACHEGNYGLGFQLSAARGKEKQMAAQGQSDAGKK